MGGEDFNKSGVKYADVSCWVFIGRDTSSFSPVHPMLAQAVCGDPKKMPQRQLRATIFLVDSPVTVWAKTF